MERLIPCDEMAAAFGSGSAERANAQPLGIMAKNSQYFFIGAIVPRFGKSTFKSGAHGAGLVAVSCLSSSL